MEQVGICARSGQTSHQTVLKHIGAAAGVLTDDDAGRLVVAVALTQGVVVPAQKTTNLVAWSAVKVMPASPRKPSAKIFSHYISSSFNLLFFKPTNIS